MNLQLKLEGKFFLKENDRPTLKSSEPLKFFPGSISRILRKVEFKASSNNYCNFLAMHGMGSPEEKHAIGRDANNPMPSLD